MKQFKLEFEDITVVKNEHLQITVNVFGELPNQSGHVESNLPRSKRKNDSANGAFDAVESLILAHACEGIQIDSQPYRTGVLTVIEAILNNLT